MHITTFDELALIIEENVKEDPGYCDREIARFVQNSFRCARRNQDAANFIYQRTNQLPSETEWNVYLQGVAELLINLGVKPSYNVDWVTEDKLPNRWIPIPTATDRLDHYAKSTPPELMKRNIITGDGIIKAI